MAEVTDRQQSVGKELELIDRRRGLPCPAGKPPAAGKAAYRSPLRV